MPPRLASKCRANAWLAPPHVSASPLQLAQFASHGAPRGPLGGHAARAGTPVGAAPAMPTTEELDMAKRGARAVGRILWCARTRTRGIAHCVPPRAAAGTACRIALVCAVVGWRVSAARADVPTAARHSHAARHHHVAVTRHAQPRGVAACAQTGQPHGPMRVASVVPWSACRCTAGCAPVCEHTHTAPTAGTPPLRPAA